MHKQRPVVVEKRKVGRPRQEPAAGERVVLSFRITPQLKRALEAAADANGRSGALECELRLERSFEQDKVAASLEALRAEIRRLRVRPEHLPPGDDDHWRSPDPALRRTRIRIREPQKG